MANLDDLQFIMEVLQAAKPESETENPSDTNHVKRPNKDRANAIHEWKMSQLARSMADIKPPPLYKSLAVGPKHCCKKPLDELQPITLDETMVPKVHLDCFLLCRTITTSVSFICIGTLIEDTKGNVESVCLYNLQEDISQDPEKLIPEGTIMIIKEPYIKYSATGSDVTLRCDSPSDIIFLDATDSLLKSLAPQWHENIPTKDTFQALKKEANYFYRKKEFGEAIRFYNRALQIEPENAVIFLNKSAAFLQLGRFCEAYAEAKKAHESSNSQGIDEEKALFRMGKAAYGMRNWDLALDHFTTLLNLRPNNALAPDEISKSKARTEEAKTGKYGLRLLYDECVIKGNCSMDIADFVGPVEVADIQGKGKGLIATKDVEKGSLLLASKAFSFSDIRGTLEKMPSYSENTNTDETDSQTAVVNVFKTIHVLKNNPNRTEELYSLFAGDTEREEKIPYGVIDIDRIEKICSFNSLNPENNYSVGIPLIMESEECKPFSTGLWILPSFVNHSCIPSSIQVFYGDVLMLYALKDLKKGDEITMSYANPLDLYETRVEIFENYKFKCECRLCQLDRVDEINDEPNRMKLVGECTRVTSDLRRTGSCVNLAIEQLRLLVDEMGKTYENRIDFNFNLSRLAVMLGELFKMNGEMKKVLDCYDEVMNLHGELDYLSIPLVYFKFAEFSVKSGEIEEARKYLQQGFEKYRTKTGVDSIEVFKHIHSDLMKQLSIYEFI